MAEANKTIITPFGRLDTCVSNKFDNQDYNVSTIPKDIFLPGTDNKIWYRLQSVVFREKGEDITSAVSEPAIMVNVVNSQIGIDDFHAFILNSVKNERLEELKKPSFYEKHGYESVAQDLHKLTPTAAEYFQELGHIFISNKQQIAADTKTTTHPETTTNAVADSNLKVAHFTGDEYLKIAEVAEPFWKRGATGSPPKFVIFMGGVGAGKTTIRRQQFAEGFVHFDFGEICNAFKRTFSKDGPRLLDYVAMASDMILRESINEKKNIVIEIIGETADMIKPVIDSMSKIGYEISVNGITCDVAEAYQRHLQAVHNDPDYLSAAHTQEATLSFFFSYFNLRLDHAMS